MATNQWADHHNFNHFEMSLPKQHLYKISHTATVILEMSFKKSPFIFFLNLKLPWQPNKRATGHKIHELGRQSSNDHLPNMVHIATLVMEKMQFDHFLIISLWKYSVTMATIPRSRLADI